MSAKPRPLPRGATEADRNRPVQFRTRYRLADRGRDAAESGEYDQPHTPQVTELRGLAAEVFGAAVGGRAGRQAAGERQK